MPDCGGSVNALGRIIAYARLAGCAPLSTTGDRSLVRIIRSVATTEIQAARC
jgi:hypothetical protein